MRSAKSAFMSTNSDSSYVNVRRVTPRASGRTAAHDLWRSLMKRTYVIGGIVAAAVSGSGGAATGVARAGSGDPTGGAYGSAMSGAPAGPAVTGVGTAALKPGSALV